MSADTERQKKAYTTADNYAKSKGYSSIDDMMNNIKDGLNSNDINTFDLTLYKARGVVEDLSMLILRQELYSIPQATYMSSFISMFSDGYVTEGNAKQYILDKPTGKDTWSRDSWIPEGTTTTSVDQFVIKMYESKNTLSQQAYQFKKPITFISEEWIPFFKSGNLGAFISHLQNQITQTKEIFLFDLIAKKITSHSFKKTISGTAENAFDCYVNEILPAVGEMITYSNDFNLVSSQTSLGLSNPSDLIVIAHNKTIQTLRNGIRTQLFNAQLFNFANVLDESNIINLGRKMKVGTTEEDITVDTGYYVDENTIIVLNKKNSLKHWKQVNRVETQSFAQNMSTTIVSHEWGALDILPWGQGFKYTNANLNRMP